MEGCTFPAFQASNIRGNVGKTGHSKFRGTWKFGDMMISGNNWMSENSGVPGNLEIMISRKNGTSEKFMGTRKFGQKDEIQEKWDIQKILGSRRFGKIMISRKSGTSKFFGHKSKIIYMRTFLVIQMRICLVIPMPKFNMKFEPSKSD